MSPGRLRPLAAAALAAALAGCGGSNDTTVTQTVAAPQGTNTGTVTVPEIGPPKDRTGTGQSPPQQTPPQQQGGTRSQAVAKLRAEGYRTDDPGDYDSGATLRVLVGTRADSGDGYAKRAFFFVGGRYIGTDTSDDSANIRVESSTD